MRKDILPDHELKLVTPVAGKTMLELGNKRNGRGVYKTYFQHLGIEHTSVDLNGKDGALPKDLQKPLGLGQFDIVTNFGTTEHVERQEPAWRNIAKASGGVFVSTTPLPGDWGWHGRWYPTEDFYRSFAELNGFEIERMYVDCEKPRRMICVRMVRVDDLKFKMPDASLIYDNGDVGVGRAD
jgi:hypothetical protein